jgi:thioredoxin 1
MATLKQLDGRSFDLAVNNSDVPVLVDFYADWCGPCKALAPTLETLAGETEGALSIVKVDIDDNPDLASRFGIQSIPTLVVFKDGEAVGQIAGLVPKEELKRQLNVVLDDQAVA